MKTRHLTFLFIIAFMVSACSSPTSVPITPDTGLQTTSIPVTPTDTMATWLTVPVTDALTGKTFAVNDLKGKVVLVEGMATWCPTCWAQGRELKTLKQQLNADDSLVIVSLTLDSKEDASVLKEYAATGGFDWFFVTSSIDIYRDIGNRYGATYLDPTLAPLFIVDKDGHIQNFRKGKIPAAELETIIRPLLGG
jgi:cytochrome oxidase Cu insertion factor (SCO1/SenC/PrrC family)